MELYKWKKIDISTHIRTDIGAFHVNIPNFMYMYSDDVLNRVDKEGAYYDNFNALCDWVSQSENIDEKYLMEENRVMPFVFSIREMNKLHNAIKAQYDVDNSWDINTLRFFKYGSKYLVTNDCKPLDWHKFTNVSFVGV